MSKYESLYNQSNRSGSSSNLNFSRSSQPSSNTSASQKPSFAASSSSLPSALGIASPSTSNLSISPSASNTTPGWTLSSSGSSSSNNNNNTDDHLNSLGSNNHWQRSLNSSSFTPVQDRYMSPQKRSIPPFKDEMEKDRPAIYQMRSNSSSSLIMDGMGVKVAGPATLKSSQSSDGFLSRDAGRRPSTAGSASGSAGSPSNHSGRNFLIPIGATGARQKLSIKSASQRPMTAQATSVSHQSQLSPRRTSDGIFTQRPQGLEGTNGSKISSSSSSNGSLFSRPSSDNKVFQDTNERDNRLDTIERGRSFSAEYRSGKLNENEGNAPLTSPRWSSGSTNDRMLPSSLSPQLTSAAMRPIGQQWNAESATPTQERPNPLLTRQDSQDSLGRAGNVLRSTPQSSPSIGRDTASPKSSSRSGRLGLGRRLASRDGEASSPDLKGSHQLTNHSSRTSDSSKVKQLSRPSSSSGRDRAAKFGAGFKSMFSSKGSREQSPKVAYQFASNSPPSTSNSSQPPLSSSQSSLQNSQSQRYPIPSNFNAQNRSFSASSSQNQIVDVNTADLAGWTASHERSNSDSTYTSTTSGDEPKMGQTEAFTSDTIRNGEAEERDDDEEGEEERGYEKTPEEAPSIDLAIPSSNSLFDDSESGRYFSFGGEFSSEGKGPTRQGKAAPTTGLNLEVAGESFPARRYALDQDESNTSLSSGPTAKMTSSNSEKSLPPTPDPAVMSSSLQQTTPPPTLQSDSKATSKGSSSTTSNWSQSTVLGPSTPISSNSFKGDSSGRLTSLTPLSDSSRRGSTATTSSDLNGSLSDAMYNNTARRPSSSAQSTSEESGYSAPNSSRAWSPAAFDKPNAPITSPLLAPVLGQSQQQQQQQPQSQQQTQALVDPSHRRMISGGGQSSNATETNLIVSPSTPASIRSMNNSTPPRPNIPTKSKERPLTLQPDPATLAKLEKGPLQQAPQSAQSGHTSSSEDSVDTVTSGKTDAARKAIAKNPSMYVPPGALSYTRKGTVVRPSTAKTNELESAKDLSDSGETPRASLDQRHTSNEFVGSFASPVVKSRFSMASSDLPSAPNSSKPVEGEGAIGSDGQIISFNSNDFDIDEDEVSVDNVNLLPSSAWVEVESSLARFKAMVNQSGPSDKGGLLRSILLPFLALEAETPNVEVSGSGQFQSGKCRRGLFFEWIQHLLLELQTIQTSADRGAILESIACIIESRNFSAKMFQTDEEDEKKFYSVFGHILNYAIGELNKKGVYQNTLIFSGRLLAVAFFRVAGVASKLLRALPVNRFALERVAAEARWERDIPNDWEGYKKHFPSSLHDFCFQDARSYLKVLDAHSNPSSSSGSSSLNEVEDDDRYLVRQPEVEVEMSGNWLRRWQSDDSELFFSFCRSYHRQLAGLLANVTTFDSIRTLFFGGPGYAHLATCIHQKCLSLVHRDILSVTTLSSQKNFNPGETANVLSGSTAGKPRHLEAANRRCTAIVVDIVRAPSSNNHLFGPMLGIHVKCLIKRTSLYDVQGVFCLLDWLDGVLGHMESAEFPIERLVDIEFVIETVWLLLKDADHALALMRTIAFCYSNFAVLTSTSKNRTRFCEDILLNPKIFQKLFLSWSFTIRAYFLHLLVFRLARINDFAAPEDDIKGKTAISVARLFNQRLDEIRKRHDELSPSPSSADSGSEEDDESNRYKKRPQSFVSTIKHTPSVHKADLPGTMTKAERVLGIGLPDPVLSSKGESKAQSRAAKWLRVLGGKGGSLAKGGGKRNEGGGGDGMTIESPYLGGGESPNLDVVPFAAGIGDTSRNRNEMRKRMPKLDELDLDSDDDNAEEDERYDGSNRGEEENDVETPRAKDGYVFNFEARPGSHENQQQQAGGRQQQGSNMSLGDLSPKSSAKPTLASNEDDDKQFNDHISPDVSFDLQNSISNFSTQAGSLMDGSNSSSTGLGVSVVPAATTNNGKLATPHSQGRISRAFSKRESILPGPAFHLVSHETESDPEENDIKLDLEGDMDPSELFALQHAHRKNKKRMVKADPYHTNLHIYAVQSLREYEQTVQEHDDFFSSQADATNPQVPRLPIQWPAMWSE